MLDNWTPPHLVLREVLDGSELAELLEHVRAQESAFRPTGLTPDGEQKQAVHREFRRSVGLRDVGCAEPLLRSAVYDRAPELMARLGLSVSGTLSTFETQLVAHGDGDFYKLHIDLPTGSYRENVRALSGVFYFHRTPRAFSGGALRIYSIDGRNRFVDIEPTNNTLLLFPPWAPHEVRPVTCPSGRFMDSRFSVNCWVYQAV